MVESSEILGDFKPGLSAGELAWISDMLKESSLTRQSRLQAMEMYNSFPLPDRVKHLWRYTDPLSLLPREAISPLPAREESNVADLDSTVESCRVDLSSSFASSIQLGDEARRARAEVVPLAEAGSHLRAIANSAVSSSFGLFEALNAAVWSSGVAIYLPAGAHLDLPLRIVVHASAAVFPRILVWLDEGAEAKIVVEHVEGDSETKVIGVGEYFVGDNARLDLGLKQNWGNGVSGHLTERVFLGVGSQLNTALGTFGGSFYKLDFGAVLQGTGARSEIVGVALAKGKQHFDIHTEQRHHASATSSNMHLKVAVSGKAESAYTGLIRIEKDAAECEAFQEERNLLLNRGAKAQAIPELEILNYETRCSHGATTSTLAPAELHYLQSRGLSFGQAKQLIVGGFLESAIRRLPAGLRGEFEKEVAAGLSGLVK